ncbi:FAD-binding oxidoreductase [Nonomuraea sp. NPDC050540]|uniref:FAD-binding oxidoreductase n=1 Tax=Nonomuraea sp. NPDC050540 TaxID=3364367 RepID=UPI00379CA76D
MRIDTFSGPIHLPGDPGYDGGRWTWNQAVDQRPAVVAEALGAEDVRAALLAARERGLPLTVQATGHGTLVPADGGLLLKTTRMAGVEIDPVRRVAVVEPGAVWEDVLSAAAAHGLAPLAGVPSVGVTGYTLGGGAGWLSRLYGLAADNVVGAEVVTADGRILEADEEHHPDLFWALRGGSGNFGVVTRLEFRLFPVARMVAGMTMHAFERAGETLAAFRDWEQPDTVNAAVFVIRMPDGTRMLGVRVVAVGEPESVLAPLLSAAGEPLSGEYADLPYEQAVGVLAPAHGPMPLGNGFEYVRDLPDDLIAALMESPVGGIEIRRWGGAMAAPGGPAGHRDVPFSVMAGEPIEVPHATGGAFLNFLTDTSRTADAFTPAGYARLRELKKAWDPEGVLRPSHLIEAE